MSDLGHYDYHPAYRGQGGPFILKAMKFGRDRSNVPNIEAEYGRGGPWFSGGTDIALFDEGVTPIGAVYEPLTDDLFGAGLADTDLYQASFDDLRTAQEAASPKIRISVDQGDDTDLRSYLASIFEYYDGWAVMRGTQLAVGAWQQGDIDTSALPVIGSDDLTSEPRMRWTGFDDCYTEVNVTYRDRDQYFHDGNAAYRNPGMLQILGEARTAYIQRRFIIDATMANTYAAFYGQRFGRPGANGEIDVKLESIEAIEDDSGMPIVGQLITCDSASWGEEIVLRVTECEYPADEGPFYCTLTVELERSIWPALFVQPPPDPIGNFVVEVPNIVNRKVVELPSGLTTSWGIQVAMLAQRPAKNVVGFHTWKSPDNVTYYEHSKPCTFAAFAKCSGATGTGTTFNVIFYGVDLPDSQTTQQKNDYNLLLFVDDEIMSVGAITPLGAGVYSLSVLRGRYGTTAASHLNLAGCYAIQRDQIIAIGDKNFVVGNTEWFKLQPYDARQTFDLASVTAFSYLFGGGAVATPTVTSTTAGYGITGKGEVDSYVTMVWTMPVDQNWISFDVRYKKHADSAWIQRNVGNSLNAVFDFLDPAVSYDFAVRALDANGQPGGWSATQTITTANSPTLAKPTFKNSFTGSALGDSSYSDITAVAVQAQVTTGKKARYSTNGPCTISSPFWPADGGGDYIAGTNTAAGFIQSNGLGPDQIIVGGPPVGPYKHTTVWHVCSIDPLNPTVLGPEAIITSTYVPVDMGEWPQVPKPVPYVVAGDNAGKVRGDAGYQVRIGCQDATALIYHTPDPATVAWTLATRDTVKYPASSTYWFAGYNHYFQARRYVSTLGWDQWRDSEIATFSNTASGLYNQEGGGGTGGVPNKIQP